MNYSIGQVSELFNLPISTLRYYDRQGLFKNMKRSSGQRVFSESELEALRVIDCLKKSGLEIRDIQHFMDLAVLGAHTYPDRKNMFDRQLDKIEAEIRDLEKAKAMILFKQWYYSKSIELGDETLVQAMIPEQLPDEIREAWMKAHDQK